MLVLSECMFRVLKNDLRARMRELLKTQSLPRVSPFQQLLCEQYSAVLSRDNGLFWIRMSELLRRKFGDRVLLGASVDALSHVKQLAKGAVQKIGVADGDRLYELVDAEYILSRLNSYFGGIEERALSRLVKDGVVSLYDFGLFQPSVKHLGLTHFAAGRSLALLGMASPLLQLAPAQAKQSLRRLKESRLNLLRVLSANPDNVATLVLLARIDLFPVCYFVESGDLHLVEVNIRRAIDNLRLALRYESGSEISALLVVAASRFMQFCTAHFNAEMSTLYETHLAEALKRDEYCLDSFFEDTLRERNALGRQVK